MTEAGKAQYQAKDNLSFIKILKWVAGVIGGLGALGLAASLLAWYSFRGGNLQAGTRWLSAASPITWTLSRLTLRQVSLLEVWHEGVWLGREAGKLQLPSKQGPHSEPLAAAEQLQKVWSALPRISAHFDHFLHHFQRSWILSKIIPDSVLPRSGLEKSSRFVEALTAVQESRGRYLVIFQNTDELRATGGFMGSYAVLDFASEHPFELTVHDIYDPSGVSISLPSPPGQEEYLSEGQGMRLTDANWSPDFPTSAALIVQYFQNIRNDSQNYDGVIAVPLSAVEDLIAAAGGVYMVDTKKLILAEELADAARQNRDEFFPGSQEKIQFLQSFYRAFLLKIADFSPAEWQAFATALLRRAPFEDIQFYAVDPAVQAQFAAAQLDGALSSFSENTAVIIPVESNVGINKANRAVTRDLTLAQTSETLTLTAHFRNAYTAADRPSLQTANAFYNTAPHLAYVNYYRFLVPSAVTIRSIVVGEQRLSSWDEDVIVSSNGQSFRQIGFLVVVPEEGTMTVRTEWTLPPHINQVSVWRQVGVVYDEVRLQCGTLSPVPLSLSGRVYQGSCENHIQ